METGVLRVEVANVWIEMEKGTTYRLIQELDVSLDKLHVGLCVAQPLAELIRVLLRTLQLLVRHVDALGAYSGV